MKDKTLKDDPNFVIVSLGWGRQYYILLALEEFKCQINTLDQKSSRNGVGSNVYGFERVVKRS